MRPIVPAMLAFLALAGSALAGTPEAPELTDAADDCAFAPGNEYADIVSAWISDETATDFVVNLRLGAWTHDALGTFAGYTLQFTHQGVQFGVAAFFAGPEGWDWSTGYIDTGSGEMRDFNGTSGSWDAATTTMSILFPKSLFPHTGNDDKLTTFIGGSADLKKDVPFFIAQELGAPVEPVGGFLLCDQVESSATYTFTTGEHTMHAATDAADATNGTAETDVVEAGAMEQDAALPSQEPARATPGPTLFALLGALACLSATRRARSRRP